MGGKLHEGLRQTALLPLRLRKAELTRHRHSLDFHHTELSGIQLPADGTHRDNAQAIGMFQKQLDALRAA